MRIPFRFFLIFIVIIFSSLVIFVYFKSGDLLIHYLANSLGFKVGYTNRCGFTEAFVFKIADLKSSILEAEDYPLKIKCDNARIQFDYSEFFKKGAVGLRCELKEPMLFSESKEKESGFLAFVPQVLFSMLGETTDFQYDSLFCNLLLYGNTAEIQDFTAWSSQIILRAKGVATGEGKTELYVEILFSPAFASALPEEANLILEDRAKGFRGFRVKIKMDERKPFLQLESTSFRLSIGESEK